MSTNSATIEQNEFSKYISQIKNNVIAMDIIVALGGAALIGLLARVAIPLWFTPVPITGQTLGVIACILAMKRNRAILSMVFYMLLSMLGIPLLASQESGWGGISWLTKPISETGWIVGASAGYVYGFLLATIVCRLIMRNNKSIPMMIVASFVFTIITYVCGIYWLHHTLNPMYGTPYFGGPNSAFALGCWPFLIGDILKSITAITVTRTFMNRIQFDHALFHLK